MKQTCDRCKHLVKRHGITDDNWGPCHGQRKDGGRCGCPYLAHYNKDNPYPQYGG